MIEPGEKFVIGYGKGHTIEVVALSARQKSKVVGMLESFAALERRSQIFELAIEAMQICVPGVTDEQLDTMNETMMLEIVGKTTGEAALSKEELKKLGLVLSSDAARSVEAVALNAEATH